MPARALKEILAELSESYDAAITAAGDDDAKKKEARDTFVGALREDADEIFNAVHSSAFGAGKLEGRKGVSRFETELKAEKIKTADLESRLLDAAKTLEEKAPDVAKLKKSHADELQRVRDEFDAKEQERAKKDREKSFEASLNDVRTALIEGGMYDSVARGRVLELRESGAVKLNEDGAIEYYKLDDVETPYPTPKKGEKPFSSLVADALKRAQPYEKRSNVDRGAGARPGQEASSSSTTTAVATEESVDKKRLTGGYVGRF